MFIKKNQIIIFVLALLLVTAGYLGAGQGVKNEELEISTTGISKQNTQDENETLGDATLVDSPALVPNEPENTIITNVAETIKDDYFASSKLQRETMYSQTIESYQKIIDSSEISAEQKVIAQNEIIKINNEKNAIMIIENLIITKGFNDVVLFINGKSVNVIVKASSLAPEAVAQIQNIVSRELSIEISNIHISTK